jgi:hypothetical protein
MFQLLGTPCGKLKKSATSLTQPSFESQYILISGVNSNAESNEPKCKIINPSSLGLVF